MAATSGAQIKAAREQKGLTQKELADEVGTRQQTIDKIENNRVRNSRWLLPIQEHLGIVGVTEGVGRIKKARSTASAPALEERMLSVFVVYSTAAGEDHAEDIAMVLRPSPMLVPRPTGLGPDPELYCMQVNVGAMSPAYEPGDLVYLAHLQPELNTDVLLRKEESEEGGMVIFGRLVGDSRDSWQLQQHSRKRSFPVAKNEYPLCHQIIWVRRKRGPSSRYGQI